MTVSDLALGGLRAWGLGFGLQSLRFGAQGLRLKGLGFRGSGFKV